MRTIPKKTTAILVGSVLAIGVAGGAYAYWTGTGTGTATSTAGTTAAITINQTSTVAAIGPGVTPQPLSGTFTNTGAGPVYITSLTGAVTVIKAAGAAAGTCDATDFTIAYTTGTTMPVGAEIAKGTGVGTWSGATIAFNDKATNQDACKLATVTITYTAI